MADEPESAEPRVGERRPGGRSARVRAAVLEATIAELAETTFDELSIDDVARRAGVNKTTVYRRWPTKVELVTEAALANSEQFVPMPDTGTFAGDLAELARSVAANIGVEPGSRITRNLVAVACSSEAANEGMLRFWSRRLELATVITHHAIARGELDREVDASLVIEALIGALYVRLLLTGGPITTAIADEVATLVHAGVTAVADQRRRLPKHGDPVGPPT